MTRDLSQIPYLVKLLNDPDPHIRNVALREFASLGLEHSEEIIPYLEDIPFHLSPYFHFLMDAHYREWFNTRFWKIFDLSSPEAMLERGFALICQFQNGKDYYTNLHLELFKLATEFIYLGRPQEPQALVEFLFEERGFSGVEEDYYNPIHSNLVAVCESKRGIPISLSCLLVLLAQILNIPILPCAFPSHFMAKYKSAHGEWLYVDCFNSGKTFDIEGLCALELLSDEKTREFALIEASPQHIFVRVLNNMAFAYGKKGQSDHAQLMQKMSQKLMYNIESPSSNAQEI